MRRDYNKKEESLDIALEEARDRVVDMLVNVARQGRGGHCIGYPVCFF
jgi:hypothetical protein